MSDQSYVDQAKQAASDAGAFLGRACAAVVRSPHNRTVYVGNKLTNSVKSAAGANPVKVRMYEHCFARVYAWHYHQDRSTEPFRLALQKMFKDFLTGRVCVVTGGGRGIGKAIAERYAAEGFTIILTARSRDQLEEASPLVPAPHDLMIHYSTVTLALVVLQSACLGSSKLHARFASHLLKLCSQSRCA